MILSINLLKSLTPTERRVVLAKAKQRAREKEKARAKQQQREFCRTEDGIVWFVRHVLGVTPTAYQEQILRALVRYRRVAVRGPHGLGKTAVAAWVVLWLIAVYERDAKAITTASAWRQLERYLWPEVRKWALRADWGQLGISMQDGRELLKQSLKIGTREAFPVASDNPALIEGAHATTLLYVFDESKSIPDPTWDAAEGAFSQEALEGKRAFALAISTPGDAVGRFWAIHRRKPGLEQWHTIHVKLEEAIQAGQISQSWADARRRQWGENSSLYLNRVLGEFDERSLDRLIPMAWVEEAQARYADLSPNMARPFYGLDVAREGADKSALATLAGRVILPIEYWGRTRTTETVGRVKARVDHRRAVYVDIVGVGAGVYDMLRDDGYNTVGINAGWKTALSDRSGELEFLNLRAAGWWLLREALDPDGPFPIALPPDDDRLLQDLTEPSWSRTRYGKIKIESKDDLRKRMPDGRSTDGGDAVVLALLAAIGYLPDGDDTALVYDESMRATI